ncbi:hypothetical protein ABHZ63_04020, partial [Phocaeicola vulgatus]
ENVNDIIADIEQALQ